MAVHEYYEGSTGPFLYDDTETYDDGVAQIGFRSTASIRTEDFMIIGLNNPILHGNIFVSLGDGTSTNLFPNVNISYPAGLIECFTSGHYGNYHLDADDKTAELVESSSNTIFGDASNNPSKVFIDDSGSEWIIQNDSGSTQNIVMAVRIVTDFSVPS